MRDGEESPPVKIIGLGRFWRENDRAQAMYSMLSVGQITTKPLNPSILLLIVVDIFFHRWNSVSEFFREMGENISVSAIMDISGIFFIHCEKLSLDSSFGEWIPPVYIRAILFGMFLLGYAAYCFMVCKWWVYYLRSLLGSMNEVFNFVFRK